MNFRHFFSLILIILSLSAFSSKELLTVAERTDFKETSLNKDVFEFITQLEKTSEYIKIENIATSYFGNQVPIMIIANPMPESYKDIKNDDRMVIYIQANIHAGEIEGKEASLMFARDLLKDPNSELLKKLIILITPNFNPDGNDQISDKNRTNQNGPNAVGLRHNGMQLDINRDGLKLETPELQGLIKNVFMTWDPALTVDCHTTNGSYHEEPITFTWQVNPNGDRKLINYMRDQMMPSVNKDLKNKYDVENCYYGNFMDRTKPEKGWIFYAAAPRYLTNYIGIRNRFAILNENYVYADYKTRVMGCYYLLKTIAEYAAENAKEMKAQITRADKETIARGIKPALTDSFAVQYKGQPTPEKIQIKAIEAEVYRMDNGWRRYRPTNRKRTVTVDYIADYLPTKQVKFPYAYIIDKKDKAILENLKGHGIEVKELKTDIELEVIGYEFEEIKPNERLNQGHYTNKTKGKYVKETKLFKKGSYIVTLDQKLANVAAYLLEAESEDSLLTWNYFDRYLIAQWGSRIYPYPVYKLMEPTKLKLK